MTAVDPGKLPIHELESAIVEAVRGAGRLVLRAPTGSGKSTQVPSFLERAGLAERGLILVLQPRRLPARMLARRVAAERGEAPGGTVGYQMRFEEARSRATKILFITEALLLRMLLDDPELKGVAVVVFDEFHERHLVTDVSLALCRELQRSRRPDLKLVVMSATLETGALKSYLEPCAVLESEGRMHPVRMEYLDRAPDPRHEPVWDLAAEAVEEVVRRDEPGDVLVFMPGVYEIFRTVDAVKNRCGGRGLVVLPLHGELSPEEQDAAMERYEGRKVVVSTNVAETSLTIDGVRVVIDAGLARVPRFDPHRGINTLLVEKISRASADQRAGRAGRTAPGVCRRLWTTHDHAARPGQETPEIRRIDLAETLLTLKAAGVESLASFPWFEPPDPKALERGELLLRDLGALDEEGKLTGRGRTMARVPAHPRYARMLLEADDRHCVRPVALIAALTQERSLLGREGTSSMSEKRDDFLGEETESDFFRLMRAWKFAETSGFDVNRCRSLGIHARTARQVGRIFSQFLALAERMGLDTEERPVKGDDIRRCILAGFSDQLALRLDEGTLRCRLVHGRSGVLARESVVQGARLFVSADIREIEVKRGQQLGVVLGLATAVEEAWLRELFPGDFVEREEVHFDATQRRVVVRRFRAFRDLVLEQKDSDDPPAEAAAAVLAGEVAAGRLVLKKWDEAVEQWITRLNCLAAWCPELGLPPLRPEDRAFLLEQICNGAVCYRDIKDREVMPLVRGWLSREQQSWVEEQAPERFDLPGGRRAKIRYQEGAEPVLSARIQDLYGVDRGLCIGFGNVPLVLEILAPNFRPVQITRDLAKFWKETYPQLKPELQRRYPKHKWI
jgi:ATP-dependent helicase HrpB